jgi:hypothetical protein
MTLFSVARPVAFRVPRAPALPPPFRPSCCNRIITHERDWWSACCRVTGNTEVKLL